MRRFWPAALNNNFYMNFFVERERERERESLGFAEPTWYDDIGSYCTIISTLVLIFSRSTREKWGPPFSFVFPHKWGALFCSFFEKCVSDFLWKSELESGARKQIQSITYQRKKRWNRLHQMPKRFFSFTKTVSNIPKVIFQLCTHCC